MEELWVEVDGYPNYIVSNYGEVISLNTDRRLSYRPNDKGYLRVALSHEGVIRDFYVHQLVAKTFFRDFNPGTKVKHRNGDITNNRVDNLMLNRGNRVEELEVRRGERDPWGKKIRIVETGEIFRTARECARYLKGDYSSIYACLRGERRKHLGHTFEYVEEY